MVNYDFRRFKAVTGLSGLLPVWWSDDAADFEVAQMHIYIKQFELE